MTLKEIAKNLELEVVTSHELDQEPQGGYASDLLSDVIANAQEGDIWVTLQIHLNIVAVAAMKGVSAIITVNGRRPDEATISKANEEGITIMVSVLPTFEVVGKLYSHGVRGVR